MRRAVVRSFAVLTVLLVAPSLRAQPADALSAPATSGVLIARPSPDLGFALAGYSEPEHSIEHSEALVASHVGPRSRAAWHGAKTGLLVGAGIGALAVVGAGLYDANQGGCDYICNWHIATALAVPFTAFTTLTGAYIGAATASPVPPVDSTP